MKIPIYEYVCNACGTKLEIIHSIKSSPKKKCPKCDKMKLIRLISKGACIIFKGKGWTRTESYNRQRRAEMEREVSGKDCSEMTHGMGEGLKR